MLCCQYHNHYICQYTSLHCTASHTHTCISQHLHYKYTGVNCAKKSWTGLNQRGGEAVAWNIIAQHWTAAVHKFHCIPVQRCIAMRYTGIPICNALYICSACLQCWAISGQKFHSLAMYTRQCAGMWFCAGWSENPITQGWEWVQWFHRGGDFSHTRHHFFSKLTFLRPSSNNRKAWTLEDWRAFKGSPR